MPFFLFCVFFRLCAGFLQAPPDSPDLVQSIEQQRGGRHWIDQKTDPPKSPDESQACFQIEPGFTVQLVAAEPLVFDPVAIDFDSQGQMFVAEYGDYPVGPADPAAPALSRVIVLRDIDGDGRMDQRQVFAEHLRFCHSLMCLMDGVLACTDTEIVFLKDTDADGQADLREVWFDGFEPAHPQMQIGCPRWGHDNWIYLTYGPGKIRCRRPGFESENPVTLPQLDFRFHPLTMKFESVTGLGQFGNTIDNDGHRFFSTNRNPIMTDVLSRSVMSQNPFHSIPVGHTDVGPGGEQTRVFPLVAMKSNWLSHAGTHTSACGVTAYRGDLFGSEGDRSVFACEPVGHLVTRNVIHPDGATVTSTRARPDRDFLASTDTWFRPASLANGPDGGLYLADMYRLWVEHPKFVPEDVAARMDWRAGEDRGRIWRIVPTTLAHFEARSFPTLGSDSDLIALLKDSSGWRRLLGQRLIVERQLKVLVPKLAELAADNTAGPYTRMQALWCLHGLNALTPDVVIPATNDASALVRRHAVRMVGELLKNETPAHDLQEGRQGQAFLMLYDSVLARLNLEQESAVLLEALVIPAVHSDPKFGEMAGNVISDRVSDRWLRAAVVAASAQCSGELLQVLVPRWQAPTVAPASRALSSDQVLADRSELLRQLATIAAIRGDVAEVQSVIQLFRSQETTPQWWQTSMLIGLAQGLPATRGPEIPKSLSVLLQSPPSAFKADSINALRELMTSAVQVSLDRELPESTRVAAIRLLPFHPPEIMNPAFGELLQPEQPLACQLAAMDGIRQTGRVDLATTMLNHWNALGPQVRTQLLDLLLNRKDTILSLFDAIRSGQVAGSGLSIDQRLRLLQSTDPDIRETAADLFGGTVSADRKKVATEYAAAIDLPASPQNGAQIFQKSCSKCHRVQGTGHQVGPDISDTRSRARDALLYDILDPNRRVDPQYTEYVVQTTDGRTLAGLLISEDSSSIVLKQPEGVLQTVSRVDVEVLKSSNRSLMPEGIEKDLSVQQMADLIEFLKTQAIATN